MRSTRSESAWSLLLVRTYDDDLVITRWEQFPFDHLVAALDGYHEVVAQRA